MRVRRLGRWLCAVAGVLLVVVVLDSSGMLSDDAEIVVDNGAQLGAGMWAMATCALTARRVSGLERSWRWLMAVGMAGWSVGQALWSWYQIFSDTPLPSPSAAD